MVAVAAKARQAAANAVREQVGRLDELEPVGSVPSHEERLPIALPNAAEALWADLDGAEASVYQPGPQLSNDGFDFW